MRRVAAAEPTCGRKTSNAATAHRRRIPPPSSGHGHSAETCVLCPNLNLNFLLAGQDSPHCIKSDHNILRKSPLNERFFFVESATLCRTAILPAAQSTNTAVQKVLAEIVAILYSLLFRRLCSTELDTRPASQRLFPCCGFGGMEVRGIQRIGQFLHLFDSSQVVSDVREYPVATFARPSEAV